MLAAYYPTKKHLKSAIGQGLRYSETSMVGTEYKSTGSFCVVGPSATQRVWFAKVTMADDVIRKVE